MHNDPLDPANDPTRGRAVLNGDDFDMSTAPTYAKVGKVRAIQMLEPFVVVTLEGIQHGEEGDFLAEAILSDGSPGERWPVRKSRFVATYRLNDIQAGQAPAEPGEFGADPRTVPCPDRGMPGHTDACTVYASHPRAQVSA